MSRLVLFVCNGNIFRSAVALAFARQLAVEQGVAERYEFNGAGLYSLVVGWRPEATTIAEMMRYGLDLSAYRARKLTAQEAHAASLIVAMTRQQAALISACFGVAKERIVLLYDLIGEHRSMPDVGVGGYASVPVRVAQIRRCLRDGWSRLIELAERDVPVWEPDPPATGERVLLCPITLPDGLPCPHRGAYRYRTRCPDPRPNSRWQREGEVISLAEAGLDIEEVALQVLPRTIHVSSGGVVYRQQEGEVLFALSQRVGESWWELPAGTVEGQEMLRQAAARELAEETGYRVELSAYVHYCYDTIFDEHPVLKVKHYFLAEAIEPTGWMDDTVTCQWCTHARALSQLAWEERFILRRALAQLMVEGKMK